MRPSLDTILQPSGVTNISVFKQKIYSISSVFAIETSQQAAYGSDFAMRKKMK